MKVAVPGDRQTGRGDRQTGSLVESPRPAIHGKRLYVRTPQNANEVSSRSRTSGIRERSEAGKRRQPGSNFDFDFDFDFDWDGPGCDVKSNFQRPP
ncbi:hypothetical protein KKC22_00200 [Myxococcota bacterium]|nr:hypothetical protein [Myxococcota bacterium]